MKLSYDAATNSLYIHLADRPAIDSDEVAPGVVLDYDAAGVLIGVDVQHASRNADITTLSLRNLPNRELLAT